MCRCHMFWLWKVILRCLGRGKTCFCGEKPHMPRQRVSGKTCQQSTVSACCQESACRYCLFPSEITLPLPCSRSVWRNGLSIMHPECISTDPPVWRWKLRGSMPWSWRRRLGSLSLARWSLTAYSTQPVSHDQAKLAMDQAAEVVACPMWTAWVSKPTIGSGYCSVANLSLRTSELLVPVDSLSWSC